MAGKAKTTEKVLDFVEEVMVRAEGSDASKLSRFKNKTLKELDAQIKERKDKIEDLNDKVQDQKEANVDTFYEVDVNRIKTTDDTKEYAKRYIQKQVDGMSKVNELESQIKVTELEIEVFETLKSKLEGKLK